MEKTIFIGNGLNRCLVNGVPWGKLLENTANFYNTSYYEDAEMPMEFERIINEYLQNTYQSFLGIDRKDIYLTVKRNISNMVNTVVLDPVCIHRKIPFSKFDNVITTNYDLLLEAAIGNVNKVSFNRNIKYLEKRTAISQDEKLSIYHAHGVADYPDTICLGYEHYMGLVEHLRDGINTKHKSAKDINICEILNKNANPEGTWGEKIYTSDVVIIGFGLPTCETDIWWLLTHRAYLFNTNYNNIRNVLKNKIVYYDIVDGEIDKKTKYKHKLLKNLHVDVKLKIKSSDDTFEMKYQEIFDEINNGSCWK